VTLRLNGRDTSSRRVGGDAPTTSALVTIEVKAQPIRVVVSQGLSRVVSSVERLDIDVSESYDPNYAAGSEDALLSQLNFAFSWTCNGQSLSACFPLADQSVVAALASRPTLSFSRSLVDTMSTGSPYYFRVVVTGNPAYSPATANEATIEITFHKPTSGRVIPLVLQGNAHINPTDTLRLTASVTESVAASNGDNSYHYKWQTTSAGLFLNTTVPHWTCLL
jgi:hypothetical protein